MRLIIRKESVRKVKGRKMIKIEAEFDEGRIVNVIISGDFFAFPIDIVERIENSLKGRKAERREIENVIKELSSEGVLVGVSFNDILEMLLQMLPNSS